MSKKEEIALVEEMIHQTKTAMLEERKDRLQLEAELNELENELAGLITPVKLRRTQPLK
jgi:hypothetical protein